MYLLTKEKNDIDSGAYATVDIDGFIVIQFFKDKDDAEFYKTQLEALDEELYITEVADDQVDKMCDLIGLAYSIVEPGEIVYPRAELFQRSFIDMLRR